jgi:hypothetical protein
MTTEEQPTNVVVLEAALERIEGRREPTAATIEEDAEIAAAEVRRLRGYLTQRKHFYKKLWQESEAELQPYALREPRIKRFQSMVRGAALHGRMKTDEFTQAVYDAAESFSLPLPGGDAPALGPLRTGRPEHLNLEAAEAHADRLRECDPDEVTIVGRLLLVMQDEVRQLRRWNDHAEANLRSADTVNDELRAELETAKGAVLYHEALRLKAELERFREHAPLVRDLIKACDVFDEYHGDELPTDKEIWAISEAWTAVVLWEFNNQRKTAP